MIKSGSISGSIISSLTKHGAKLTFASASKLPGCKYIMV